jgi:hypothetical protein
MVIGRNLRLYLLTHRYASVPRDQFVGLASAAKDHASYITATQIGMRIK